MAQYNFEGDYGNINEQQLKFINKVILEQDLNVKNVFFEPVGKAGDNFAANVKRISVEGDNGNLKMIVKTAPSNEFLRKLTNSTPLFKNEHVMYTEVLPKLVQLQKDAKVPEDEQLRFAKCYGSFAESPNEVIILEDLKTSDFVMLDKFVSLSDVCVRSILKNFAILHSLSYVLKNKELETYDVFKGKLSNIWKQMASNEQFKAHMQRFDDDIQSVLEDDNHKNIVKNKVTDILKYSIEFSEHEEGNEYSVIQQGDAWTNNIMFRFEGNKLKESILIDYQVSKNSNPVVDILYMIFNCTDHEKRTRHFYDWLDYYHQELDRSLRNFDLTAKIEYPRKQLDADVKRYGKYMFGLSLILASTLMRDPEEAGKMLNALEHAELDDLIDSMKLEHLQDETIKRLQNRIIGLIDSYDEFDLF